MISFDNFSPQDGVPIYMQIIKHIKSGIVSKTIESGDELPSRRVLSALLGINPNTIQKAYKMLEDEGLIVSHTGAKSYMQFCDGDVDRIKSELLRIEMSSVINSLKHMGLEKSEALSLIETYWE